MSLRRKPAAATADCIEFKEGLILPDSMAAPAPSSTLTVPPNTHPDASLKQATLRKIAALESSLGGVPLDGGHGSMPMRRGGKAPGHAGPHKAKKDKRQNDEHDLGPRSAGEAAPSDSVLSRLHVIESALPTHVLDKLAAIESRLEARPAAPHGDPAILGKLAALEERIPNPRVQQQVLEKLQVLEGRLGIPAPVDGAAHRETLARLDTMQREMSAARFGQPDIEGVKASIHAKLSELESRVKVDVSADDWIRERHRLDKLTAMRSKVQAAA